ncbi:MAG: HAMP domain-containing histidine kinase [Bacteroidaceae bacterium]|nr:HAMP domain-containing histidine kinase [Bacteroidaceae bacterium]
MKRLSITILAIIIGVSFVSLLLMQVFYIREIYATHKQQFEENVTRSLLDVVHQIEIDEATQFIETTLQVDNSFVNVSNDSVALQHAETNQFFTRRSNKKVPNSLQQAFRDKLQHSLEVVNEVVYNLTYTVSELPLEDRIDFNILDQELKAKLVENGINAKYHYQVLNGNGEVVYQCADYDPYGRDGHVFTVPLFNSDPVQTGQLAVHFPDLTKMETKAFWMFVPSFLFTIILLVTFIITLVIVFRQKKVAEVKNDFINNMTHEFKTPISSISLAAQMLNDDTVKKTDAMMQRLSATIMDETKRLRFQVDKVLQLSLYENQTMRYNIQEIDANELIAGIIHTFALKVERNGGKVFADINAENPFINVDEMHFTNVVFNLMDNAVKYCKPQTPLELKLSTWNEQKLLCIAVKDNGIGMKKDDVKKIFDKFYRVHTGNLHDVKGFGLGLAYVKKIVTDFRGTIQAESELGVGTTFTIKIPVAD